MTPVVMKPLGQNSALGGGGSLENSWPIAPENSRDKNLFRWQSGLNQTLAFGWGSPDWSLR